MTSLRYFAFVAITLLGTQPFGKAEDPPKLERKRIEQSVHAVGRTIQAEYFDPEVAQRVSDSLEQWTMQQRYADVRTLQQLAAKLTADLFELTQDKHLTVYVRRAEVQDEYSDEETAREVAGRRINFGVQRVEILAGNVGYLDITAFYRANEARDVLAAAMQLVRHADALILDLRDNGGGSPESVELLASYFFAQENLPLFEIVPRSGAAQVYKTASDGIFERNEMRPMYVLTSARTFSAGEGMAFLLQQRGRAEVIGEKTPGAANPGRPYPAGSDLEVIVPNGKVRSAVDGTNWEGRGVSPDIATTAPEAIRVAHLRAMQKLVEHAEPGEWRDRLQNQIEELTEKNP